MERGRKKHFVVGIILLGILMVLGVILVQVFPIMKFKNKLNELSQETYTFSIEYEISGMNIGLQERDFEGKVYGSKGEEVWYGEIHYQDEPYLEVYGRKDGHLVFSADAMFERMIVALEEKSSISVGIFKNVLNNINISMDQLEEIVGQDIVSITDTDEVSSLMQNLLDFKNRDKSYSLNKIKANDTKMLLGKDALYAEIQNEETRIVVGIPKDKKDCRVSFEIYYDDVEWQLIGEYEIRDVEEKEVPEKLVSDLVVATLKTAYQLWKTIAD